MTTYRPTTYRPTTLRLASRHCPRAVDYYEDRRPYFREVYGVGIAAHAVLELLGLVARRRGSTLDEASIRETADAMARRLLTAGRTFDGEQEPPLPADDVFTGRDLAIRYALATPLSPKAHYELGAAFSRDWEPRAYDDPSARFRLILDVMDEAEEEGDDGVFAGLVVRDYKSAWPTDASELDTVQMRAQAVAAVALRCRTQETGYSFVRQEVVNLRTGQTFSRTLWLDAEQETLARWQRDIELACEALDAMARPRPARPGAGCCGCPWALACEPASRWADTILLGAGTMPVLTPEGWARAYAAAHAQAEQLRELAKEATQESEPVRDGEALVGSVALPGRDPKATAAADAWRAWRGQGGDLEGYLAALRPGTTALEGVARKLRPRDKAGQEALMQELCNPTVRRHFGVHRLKSVSYEAAEKGTEK